MGDSPGDNEIVVVAAEVVTAPSPVVEAATLRQVSSPVESQEESQSQLECPICLQSCVHPVELPCKHIFCFLCIKGVAMQGPHGRCAICRSNIPHNVLTHPRLKDVSQLYKHVKTTSGYEWFYEARGGGWWQYDERSIQELERAFESGQTTCQLLIAGHLYDIDFAQMIQFRQNNRNLFRRIKRDTASAEKRGIAGIRLNQTSRGGDGGGTGTNNGPPPTTRRRRHNAAVQLPQNQNNLDVFSGANNRPGSQSDSSQSQPSSRSSTGSGQLVVVSESESDNECIGEDERDSDDSDYIVEEDDDMELGEEEDLGESNSEGEDEDDLRDGARAPTRRSDRSNSSTNQTPPPASATNGTTNGPPVVNGSSRNPSNASPNSNPSGRGSRGTKAEKGSRNSTSINNGGGSGGGGSGSSGCAAVNNGSSSASSPSPQFFVDGGMRTIAASNIRLSPAPIVQAESLLPPPTQTTGCNNNLGSSRTSSSSITTTTGLTCLLIGPGVRITVDGENSIDDENDEIL